MTIEDHQKPMRHTRTKLIINYASMWPSVHKFDKWMTDLLSKRFEVEISETPDFLIYSRFGFEYLKYRCHRIFITFENFRPYYQECDFVFSSDYSDNPKNFRLPIYVYHGSEHLTDHKNAEEIFRQKTKFCNFVYSNPSAKERIEFFNKLSQYKKVDSAGRFMNNIGHTIGPSYKDKLDFLKPYKFTIAFENSSYPGYTTEKIMNAMEANTVPIYWGNPEIEKDFNPESFINCHRYANFDEVIEKVIEIDNDDELYMRYLAAPYFKDNIFPQDFREEAILSRFETIFKTTQKPAAQRPGFWITQAQVVLLRALRYLKQGRFQRIIFWKFD